MPCNCDHLEPSTAERMRKKAAELLVYLHDIGRVTLMDIKEYRKVAAHVYGQGLGDAPVKKLCALLKAMTPDELDTVMSNARDKMHRQLAVWWEQHCQHDAQRPRRKP